MNQLESLQRLAVPGSITLDAGCGGLPRLSIASPFCRGELYLHGAHVTAWQPSGHAPVLWMSTQSWFTEGKPIRGGIPICWPWFGPAAVPDQPAHGFARLADWSLENVNTDPDGTVVVQLSLTAPASRLDLEVRFGRELALKLSATNSGNDPMPISEALHTYLAVGDVRSVQIHGLGGVGGQDRVGTPFPITGSDPLKVDAETDLMFQAHEGEVLVDDPSLGRQLRVTKSGSRSTVVWNPWIAKAARMPDFGDHEWPGMLCVEAANAFTDAYTLGPGETRQLGTRVEVCPRP